MFDCTREKINFLCFNTQILCAQKIKKSHSNISNFYSISHFYFLLYQKVKLAFHSSSYRENNFVRAEDQAKATAITAFINSLGVQVKHLMRARFAMPLIRE